MLDRLWKSGLPGASFRVRLRKTNERPSCRPLVETLESRRLMTASLEPISNISVPAQLGYQLALNGSGSNVPSQTFTATSSNPDIQVSVAQGRFWTVTVSHQPSTSSDVTINNESMTFQLFNDLTPTTVNRIETLSGGTSSSSGNFYTTTAYGGPGQYIPRITQSSNSIGSIIQGGSTSPTSTASTSGLTPLINTEPVQQLAFTGQYQLAMANTGQPTSTDAQFFITNGTSPATAQQTLDFNYTLFGQLVSGQQTVTDLGKVAVQNNSSGENSQPITPVIINSVALSSQNPNGVLHIDTTSARSGETATITVTATDPTTNTTSTQTFTVTIVAYNGPTNPVINFVPLANAVNTSTPVNTAATIQLNGQSGYPSSSSSVNLTYNSPSKPAHGTISQFNSSTGSLVYTPDPGYQGLDSFQYTVTSTGPNSSPASLTSRAATVAIGVGTGVTGAVRLITNPLGDVLVVNPVPRTDHGTNVINVTEQADPSTGTPDILVTVNGVLDSTHPAASSVSRLVVFGAKASDQITVDPSVTVPTTLDGGHGGKNVVRGGGGPTLEHGWFGYTTLVGGTGTNQLIGHKGFVRFQPSSTTNWIFAGIIRPRSTRGHTEPPKGTFYRFKNGRLVPVASLP